MTTNYSAQEITVLKDLEPVQIRPGMYTDTTRPNHLAQEVIDKLNVNKSIEKVAVVGAGYIGVELAEAFKRWGKKYT